MGDMRETARQFVDACDGGQGWEGCKAYCHEGASFAVQAPALAEIDSLEGYTEWAKWLLTPLPDGKHEFRSLAVDEERGSVTAYLIFRGTNTGEGGPMPPTGKSAASDYVYNMEFEDGKIRHLTKIWNDGTALADLGWA